MRFDPEVYLKAATNKRKIRCSPEHRPPRLTHTHTMRCPCTTGGCWTVKLHASRKLDAALTKRGGLLAWPAHVTSPSAAAVVACAGVSVSCPNSSFAAMAISALAPQQERAAHDPHAAQPTCSVQLRAYVANSATWRGSISFGRGLVALRAMKRAYLSTCSRSSCHRPSKTCSRTASLRM